MFKVLIIDVEICLNLMLCRLSVTTQPLDVVYNPLVLDHISEFFSRASMEGTQALHIERQLREVARVRYEELKNQTRAELVQTLDAMMEGSDVVIERQFLKSNVHITLFNLIISTDTGQTFLFSGSIFLSISFKRIFVP